jgi:hypothetical protein
MYRHLVVDCELLEKGRRILAVGFMMESFSMNVSHLKGSLGYFKHYPYDVA